MSYWIKRFTDRNQPARNKGELLAGFGVSLLAAAALGLTGCGTTPAKKANSNFFTSGSREADQRASQRMAQSEQLAGSGEGAGEKGVKKAEVSTPATGRDAASGTNAPAQATDKLSLFDRLGSQTGISNIVADFTPRVMDDPRVNWNRQGVTRGGFSIHRGQSEAWNPTPQNVALLKQHLAEFLALATGGPAQYTGKQIEPVHANMHISNPEFDAAIGDLKASLDKLKIPNLEQKELLAIIESTRSEIVTKR
jgi:hemoglobin